MKLDWLYFFTKRYLLLYLTIKMKVFLCDIEQSVVTLQCENNKV